jgi:hypothetical protein
LTLPRAEQTEDLEPQGQDRIELIYYLTSTLSLDIKEAVTKKEKCRYRKE